MELISYNVETQSVNRLCSHADITILNDVVIVRARPSLKNSDREEYEEGEESRNSPLRPERGISEVGESFEAVLRTPHFLLFQ